MFFLLDIKIFALVAHHLPTAPSPQPINTHEDAGAKKDRADKRDDIEHECDDILPLGDDGLGSLRQGGKF